MSNIDYLMKNYPLDNDSVTETKIKCLDNVRQSRGGFPPIYVCDEKNVVIMPNPNDIIKREYANQKKGISVKSILIQKRNAQSRYPR
jgi:hypothetical protein